MFRISLIVLLMLTLSVSASAKTMQFISGTVAAGENPLTVFGSAKFEVADEPLSPPNDFQYRALEPFDVEVYAADGAGGSRPIQFSLTRLSTVVDRVNLIFENEKYANLILAFDVPGLKRGDSIPDYVEGVDGIIEWSASALTPPSLSPPVLGGSLLDAMIVARPIPEPSGIAGLMGALIGFLVWRRRSLS